MFGETETGTRMIGWLTFAGLFLLFFATHSLPVRPPIKRRIVNRIGARGFTIAYSALSLLMLALLIWGAQQTPFLLLWSETPWHRPAVWVGMFAACLIIAVTIGRPNPFLPIGFTSYSTPSQSVINTQKSSNNDIAESIA